ncbi:MAG: DUF4230 domain-containing protein [Candidatus Thorarchaeota archaeon]
MKNLFYAILVIAAAITPVVLSNHADRHTEQTTIAILERFRHSPILRTLEVPVETVVRINNQEIQKLNVPFLGEIDFSNSELDMFIMYEGIVEYGIDTDSLLILEKQGNIEVYLPQAYQLDEIVPLKSCPRIVFIRTGDFEKDETVSDIEGIFMEQTVAQMQVMVENMNLREMANESARQIVRGLLLQAGYTDQEVFIYEYNSSVSIP